MLVTALKCKTKKQTNIAQQTVINPVTEASLCMTTEKRASFWVEKDGSEGCKDIEGFPEEVAGELDLEKWIGF